MKNTCPFYIIFQVLKVPSTKISKIEPPDLLFIVVFINFYISRYHFLQIFRTSFNIILKTFSSRIFLFYFRMQNLTFQLAALSYSYTRGGHSHDLTIIRLAFRTQGLHSPLTGVAFGTHYIVNRSAFASALTGGFAIYLGKAKVTTHVSTESTPR